MSWALEVHRVGQPVPVLRRGAAAVPGAAGAARPVAPLLVLDVCDVSPAGDSYKGISFSNQVL